MSQQTQSTMSVRSRGRRFRVMAGALLSAGILLVAAACGGDKGGEDPPGGDSGNAGDNVQSTVDGLKVCELVDVQTLATALGSPGYQSGPEDVAKGNGQDSAGPQCVAQIKLPQLTNTAGTKEDPIPARLNIAVVAYADQAAADAAFTQRMTEVEGFEGATSADLSGSWTKGKIVSAEGMSDNLVQALVQKDTYLVKINLQVTSDKSYKDKFPFTVDDVKTSVTDLMGTLFTAVSAKVEG